MPYYVYKLNVGANVVKAIESRDSIDYLKETLIVDVFTLAFELHEIKEKIFRVYVPTISKKTETFTQEWEVLQSRTQKHYELYLEVVKYYKETGQILYSENFLSLTEECGNLRRKFESKYPNLQEADLLSDKYIDKKYNLPIEFRVGTGITHLRRFYKIKEIIESNTVEFFTRDNLIFYYSSITEHIIIEADDENTSSIVANQIEEYLQKNKEIKNELGFVKIVPIYSEIIIEDESEVSEIEYTVVYPNPISEEVDDVLLGTLRETGGEEQITKITNKNNLLDINTLLSKLLELANVGYLKNIQVRKKRRQQNPLIVKVRTILNLEDDRNG